MTKCPRPLRGSRPVLSCENGRVGVSVKILRPTDRSQNVGRTKSLSDSETGRSVEKNRSDKVNYWLFHFSHERTGREPRIIAHHDLDDFTTYDLTTFTTLIRLEFDLETRFRTANPVSRSITSRKVVKLKLWGRKSWSRRGRDVVSGTWSYFPTVLAGE